MSVGSDLLSLLYWCMLAANTVGPGTVIVCARAGAEYQLELVWALVFASFLAFTLQEGGARLTIVSGKTLGQCLREKLGVSMTGTAPKACWAFAGAVYCGNLLYECNNFAGGIDAVFSFPGIDDLPATAVRIVSCFLYAIVVLAILYVNKVEAIGESLGVLMMAMVGLFLAVAITVGFSMAELLLGLLPKLPEKSTLPNSTAPCDMVLSLVGTTAIGFNIFLGGSMAIGKSLATCRRGIAFSTTSTFVVSSLILIVGSGAFQQSQPGGEFSILMLAQSIDRHFGATGMAVFAAGFVGAALSSMLMVVIGVQIVAEGLLLGDKDESGEANKMPRKTFWAIALSMVSIASAVILANLPRPTVILVAQLFNGLLLPVYSIALLICITDSQFMGKAPQSRCANLSLVSSVTVTLILAWRVVLEKSTALLTAITGAQTPHRVWLLGAAFLLGFISMAVAWRYALRTGQAQAKQYDTSSSDESLSSVSSNPIGNAMEEGAAWK